MSSGGAMQTPSAVDREKDKETTEGEDKGRRFGRRNRPFKKATPATTKFEGRCEDLNGHIYDCSDGRQADVFVRTTKEIALYVGKTYKYGDDVRIAVENLKIPSIPVPNDPPATATRTEVRIWEKKVDEFVKRETYLAENLKALYSLIWGQCSEALRARLQSKSNHATISGTADSLELLKNIRSVVFSYQSEKYAPQALHEAKRRFYMLTQDQHMTCQEYLEKFQNSVEVIEYCGGSIGSDTRLVDGTLGTATPKLTRETATAAQLEAAESYTKDQYLACAFILGADRNRYGKLIEDLENDFIQKRDKFPKTLVDAHSLLEHWKQNPRNILRILGTTNDGVAFTNVEEGQILANVGGRRDISEMTCYRCKEKGHLANECPKKPSTGVTMLMSGREMNGADKHTEKTSYQFHQSDGQDQNGVPKSWILLDNQSTVDVFSNRDMLEDIRKSDKTMVIRCNAGKSKTNMVGTLRGYGEVWYNPKGIANILSLAQVEKKYRVTYDSLVGKTFVVHKNDGTCKRFVQSTAGLYYLDTNGEQVDNDQEQENTVFVNTVAENKSRYTNRDYSQAALARKIQNIIGRPSTETFLRIVRNNELKNCPVTRDDILAAEDIFGPNVGSLKGKTVYRPGTHVHTETEDIPVEIMSRYRNVTLCVDIMYVNTIPFLVTISRHIKFGTVEVLKNKQSKTIESGLKTVRAIYTKRGFTVTHCHGDGEFEPTRGFLAGLGIELNVVSNDEHVPEVERYIRTVKERTRCIYNTLPFKKMPPGMVTEMVKASVFWLNMFPAQNGISDKLSPRTIVTGLSGEYNAHCQLEFGAYAQVHEEHDNSMTTRTTGAIALRPTGNVQGGYYFYSLTTGRRLNRNRWTELPMPHDVIDRVHRLSHRSLSFDNITFTDGQGNHFRNENDEDSDDDDYDPSSDSDDSSAASDSFEYDEDDHAMLNNDDDADDMHNNNHDNIDGGPINIAGVVEHHNNPARDAGPDPDPARDANDPNDHDRDDPARDAGPDPATISDGEDEIDPIHPGIHGTTGVAQAGQKDDDDVETTAASAETDAETTEVSGTAPDKEFADMPALKERKAKPQTTAESPRTDPDALYGPRSGRYNLRDRKQRDYSHLHAQLEHYVLTQLSIKQGLKRFGEAGEKAVIEEMTQLDQRDVLEPKMAHMLTREEKKRALAFLMFLKLKRCGRIKGRGCAHGGKQRVYKTKEETSAPTVSTEAVLLTAVVDAHEERDVATADVPCAFVQVDMDEVVHMRLEGDLARLLTKVDPKKYEKYVVTENGKPVIYVKLKKALYGTLQAALLFWEDLSANLQKWGFVINKYDWCVANKMIDGKQCTVVWHVDDLKISHVDPTVVDSVLDQLNGRYGQETPLVVRRGKVHDYLGMTLDYTEKGKVKIIMTDYIKEMLENLPGDMDGEAASPAANHLFMVNDTNPVLLDEDKSELFHHNTAKLLFLTKRARPDIQTAVAFLTTRVKRPDSDDYKKLGRVMRYLRGSIDVVLTLEAGNLDEIEWWIDGSFGVHPDLKSHTGGMMSLGRGAIYSTSRKQKLNTKSSTEAELVAVDDVMPQVLWTRYFLEEQGFKMKPSRVYQDNQSAMLLEKNGRGSSGKRTRHINVRYFFVTDRVKSNEVKIEYCPTGDMYGDFFTKPLQGSLFRRFRDILMNVKSGIWSRTMKRSTVPQECVEDRG